MAIVPAFVVKELVDNVADPAEFGYLTLMFQGQGITIETTVSLTQADVHKILCAQRQWHAAHDRRLEGR